MWDRRELKQRAKYNFKRAYWASVLVALIFSFIIGDRSNSNSNKNDNEISYNIGYTVDITSPEDLLDIETYIGGEDSVVTEQVINFANTHFPVRNGLTIFKSGFNTIILALLSIAGLLFYFFVKLPIEAGKNRYFMELADNKPGKVSKIATPYKNGRLMPTVEVMFVMKVKLFLWFCLFLIPGVIKSYEYRMVPYILAENPSLPRRRVFDLSKEMMLGNKFDTFVLDLSFIGWLFFSGMLLNIPYIFYVGPYVHATNAELYLTLRRQILDNNRADYSEFIGFDDNIYHNTSTGDVF